MKELKQIIDEVYKAINDNERMSDFNIGTETIRCYLDKMQEAIQSLTQEVSPNAEEVKLDSNITFKFKDEFNTAEITLSFEDIWDKVEEYVYDKLEDGASDCNCINESTNYCECQPIFEAYELDKVFLQTYAQSNAEAKWISVDERLPTIDENGEKVLIYRATNESQKLLSTSIHDTLMVKYCESGTYWMPLPEPPNTLTTK